MSNYADLLANAQAANAGDKADRAPPPIHRIIEALLFAGEQSLTFSKAANIVRGLTPELFSSAVDELARLYRRQRRPYAVVQRANGWTMALRPAYQDIRERVQGGARETKLSGPALDVLAVVAYRQPITRNEIDSLRGHESASLVRQLVRLGLIKVEKPLPGSTEPAFGTTPRFLEIFGLSSLDDLPKTADLQKL